MTHVFAVLAYKDSPYLKSCINSLINQKVRSHIVVCTSTPSPYIEEIADHYKIPVYINPDPYKGIGADWNFAYETCVNKLGASLVTLAHQDDIYLPSYTKTMLGMKKRFPDMSLFSCSAKTLKNGNLSFGFVEWVKRILRSPLLIRDKAGLPDIKFQTIRFGNPIICPSCTYDVKLCGTNLFDESLNYVLDWDCLYNLAGKQGRWICSEKPLIIYRIHDGAATKQSMIDNTKEAEESRMFNRLLPPKASEIIKRIYKKSYDAYK